LRLVSAVVTVIIPSWNGKHLLETCLPALCQSSVDSEIIIIDNGSTDGTVAWLDVAYPGIHIVKNSHNLGFAVAVNQGIRASQTPWVALLNNDAIPDVSWLAALLEVGESDASIGAVASRMMFRDNPRLVSSAGIRVDATGGAWDLWLGEACWPTAPVEIFGASGGACLYRREMLEDIGLFHEEFFAYLEDVDLAWRARLRGWRAALSPAAVVHHALSSTAVDGSAFKRYYLARNKWRVILRNYPTRPLLRWLPIILIYDWLSLARSLVTGDRAALRGRVDTWRDLPNLLEQRHAILGGSRASWPSVQEAMSPVESPITLYRRGKIAAMLARRTNITPTNNA
jgi:GT2 family glycosyltransferase